MSYPTYFHGGLTFTPTGNTHHNLSDLMEDAKGKWKEVFCFFDYDAVGGRLIANGNPVVRNDYLPSWFEDEFAELLSFFEQNGYEVTGMVFFLDADGERSLIYQKLPGLK